MFYPLLQANIAIVDTFLLWTYKTIKKQIVMLVFLMNDLISFEMFSFTEFHFLDGYI